MANVTVNFNQDVTWTSALHPGVSITATGGKTFTVSGPVGSTARQIEYVGTWSADPVEGDVIQYQYTAASGDYVDGDGDPMADAGPLTLTNCAKGPLLATSSSVINANTVRVNFSENVDQDNLDGVGILRSGTPLTVTGPATATNVPFIDYVVSETIQSGDSLTWQSDYVPVPSVLLEENFTGTNGSQINGDVPDTVGSTAWDGPPGVITRLDGTAIVNTTDDLEYLYNQVSETAFKITISFRWAAGAANINQFAIMVRGNTSNNCIIAQIRTGTGVSNIRMLRRESSSDNETADGFKVLTTDPRTGFVTFEIVDEGAGGNAYITAVNDAITATITDAEMTATFPADNNVGFMFKNQIAAQDAVLDSFKVE